MTKADLDVIRKIIQEELRVLRTDESGKPWHPSDEAALEKYLEYAIADWAHNFSRSTLSIKYKIAKIIKAEGVKV